MKKLTTFCLMTLMSISMFATPKYLVQTGKAGDPTWSQATITATKATVIDLTNLGTTLNAFMDTVASKEIWLISGTYRWLAERTGGGMTMYGGFAGTETNISQRQKVANGKPWEFVNPTVVTGADTDGNPYAHFTTNTGQKCTLDGITFTKFSDKGVATNNKFGGFGRFHGASVVNACQFIDIHAYNDKGGVFESYSDAGGGVISNCLFDNCTSGDDAISTQSGMQGGALYLAPNAGKSVLVQNCTFRACGVYHPGSNAGGAVFGSTGGSVNINGCTFENNFVKGAGVGVAVCILTKEPVQVVNCLFTGNNDYGNTKPILYINSGDTNSETNVAYVMHNTFAKNTNTSSVAFQSNGNMVCKNNIFYDVKDAGKADLYISKAGNTLYKVLTNNVYMNGLGNTTGVTLDKNFKRALDKADLLFVDYTNNNFKPRKEVNSMGDNTVATLVAGTATDILGYSRNRYVPGCYEWRLVNLHDYQDDSQVITNYDQQTVAVRAYRSLSSASFNSICLPFALTEGQIKEAFGADCAVLVLSSAEEKGGVINLQFDSVKVMAANKPYVIQPAEDVTNPVFDNVTIINSADLDIVKTAATMHGILVPTALTAGDTNQLFIGANNTLLTPSDNSKLNGMRAYITLTPSQPGVSARMIIGGKAIATAINEVTTTEIKAKKTIQDGRLVIMKDNKMYNAQGQQL